MLHEFYLHLIMRNLKSTLHRYLKEEKAVIDIRKKERMVGFVVDHACFIVKVLTFSKSNLSRKMVTQALFIKYQ